MKKQLNRHYSYETREPMLGLISITFLLIIRLQMRIILLFHQNYDKIKIATNTVSCYYNL